MTRTYVETLPEGDVHVLPDRVLIIADKLSEEVTEEDGTTYIRNSYVIVDSITPEAYSIIQTSRINAQSADIETLKDATVELTDIVLGGL